MFYKGLLTEMKEMFNETIRPDKMAQIHRAIKYAHEQEANLHNFDDHVDSFTGQENRTAPDSEDILWNKAEKNYYEKQKRLSFLRFKKNK